ncbi:hypothetical protein MIS33_09600 [Wielerella bovis]|uniref:hypothetical protein n=1 Tax=Wielerella bovis TaxID=2917790 RepID=UPI002018D7F8|nr:hypothetical protein [Wielerella bovis]MCG7657752.1 hypothetical protein [Wielerella bovis]MCG7659973.1 hypothetical protein [Wielerella bovis]ULJ64387.1 hypothetical protein MIS33_09600 [Wielerella bovis]ULJ68929.1 hypothetical protein MIS45_09185 [Wielerella bovis]
MFRANLYDLFNDAIHAVRLQYRPRAEMYAYGLPVFAIVMLAVGVSIATSPAYLALFGSSSAAFGFAIVMGITRWLVLTRALTSMVQHASGERIPFLGYTLATEALAIPSLLILPFPDLLPLISLWMVWCFWAQIAGVAVLSRQPILRICMAYVIYWLASSLLLGLFMTLFVAEGWLDSAEILKNLETYMQQAK